MQRNRLSPACHHEEHVGGANTATRRGADGAACHPKRRESKLSKDQDVGDGNVDDVGYDRCRQRRTAVTSTAQHGAADE
jgi:hypothetical protein